MMAGTGTGPMKPPPKSARKAGFSGTWSSQRCAELRDGRVLLRNLGVRGPAAALDRVVVATDSDEIVAACAVEGVEAVLTDAGHPSGTDRVAEVAWMNGYSGFDVLVNIQGDEPLVEEGHVAAAVPVAGVREDEDVAAAGERVGDHRRHADRLGQGAVVRRVLRPGFAEVAGDGDLPGVPALVLVAALALVQREVTLV